MSGTNPASNTSDNWVRLNVGGKTFQTTKDTLSRYPGSFLARLVNGDLPSEKDESGAYLVDGNPEHFDTILTYLRRGILNLDDNEKTTKDLLGEADFYNIEPLVEEIRQALRTVTKRIEMVIVSRDLSSSAIGEDLQKIDHTGYLTMSENLEDCEILQALRQKVDIRSDNTYGHWVHYITTLSDTYNTWMKIELTLRSFGFQQESNDNVYNTCSALFNHKSASSTKFVRTIRQ